MKNYYKNVLLLLNDLNELSDKVYSVKKIKKHYYILNDNNEVIAKTKTIKSLFNEVDSIVNYVYSEKGDTEW